VEGFTKPPLLTGRLQFDEDEPENIDLMSFEEGEGFRLDLWVPLQGDYNLPPPSKYVIGIDIATGTGGDTTSNSVIEVFDVATRTQVAEFADNTVPPEKLAELAIAICYWFGQGDCETYMIWEKNGPGIRFTNEIMRMAYPYVYYSKGGDEQRHYAKKTDKPGYHTSDVSLTLTPLISSMCASDATFYSKALCEECAHYLYNDQGKVENPRGRTSRDGGSRGLAHGDRAIAAALAIRAMNEKCKVRKGKDIPSAYMPPDIQKRMEGKRHREMAGMLSRCSW